MYQLNKDEWELKKPEVTKPAPAIEKESQEPKSTKKSKETKRKDKKEENWASKRDQT